MKRSKLIRKVEEIVLEEVSKNFSEYCGNEFSIGPILIKYDYKAFREVEPGEPKNIGIFVIYEGDLTNAPLRWEYQVFESVWKKLDEEEIDDYPLIEYVKKSRWESGEWQQPRGWEW